VVGDLRTIGEIQVKIIDASDESLGDQNGSS